MKVHVLQHVQFEGIGSMASWLETQGAGVSYTRFFEDSALPQIKGLDLVIAMGGPMSVNDESTLPWLRLEKQFIRATVKKGIPVLGVCLGAQIIANALGLRVYRNPQKEIGWFPIEATPSTINVLRFPEKCTVFPLARQNLRSSFRSCPPCKKCGLRKSGVPDRAACHRLTIPSRNDSGKRQSHFGQLRQRIGPWTLHPNRI